MLRCQKIISIKNLSPIVFIVLFLFNSYNLYSQAILPVSRTAWGGAEPTGWTNSGCVQRSSTFACSGNNGTTFDDNGDSRMIFFGSAPNQLVFKLKSASMSGASSLLVQESPDGSTWTNIGNYGTAAGATSITDCANITITLNCLSRYVKWTYTESTGNCDMDDVSISSFTGICSGACTAPTTTLSILSQTVCSGSANTMSVSSNASSPSYTWQASSNGSTGWANIVNGTPTGSSYSGLNSATLSFTAGSTYYYRVLVSESGTCTATSSTSTLVVNTPVTITTQPSNRTTCLGSNAGFTVAASGSPLTYQWQVNTGSGFTNISNGGVYSGATTATLSLNNPPSTMDAYEYRCIVTSAGCNTITSNDARLQIIDLPITTISPSTQTICAGSTTTINATTSAGTPSYTWQASANGTSGWNTAINNTPSGSSYSGVNTSSLIITAGNTYYYRLMVSVGGFCTSSSNTSTLIVRPNANIATQPVSVTTSSTGTASYSVIATGTDNTYQWQENSGSGFVNITNGGSNPTYAGATSTVLTISNPPLSMSGYSYQCIVSNPCSTVTTNGTSTLTVTDILTCPYLISAVINSCDGCADEGNNEFLVLNSGSYSFSVTPANIKITYSNGPTNITTSFAAQPTSLATLNTATMNTCGTTFVDVSAGTTTVPPNSTLLIINKGACFTGDWSAYCGLGTVYVAFSSATTWSTTGFFGNNTSARSFITNFSAINSSCGNTTYSYNQTGVAGTPFDFNTDGASVLFNNSSAPTYITGNGSCAPPNIILPITLLDFYATQKNETNEITWKVAEEINIQKYIIEKSVDGTNFELLSTNVPSEQNSFETKSYHTTDYNPYQNITYYRLSTYETDGLTHHIKTISINKKQTNLEAVIYQNDDNIYLDLKILRLITHTFN